MGEFVNAALGFPAVLFSFLLLVVIGYWLFVLIGAVELETDADSDVGSAGFLAGLGLGGPPVIVVLSLLIAVAWFVSLAGTVLLERVGMGVAALPSVGVLVLVLALAVAWLATRLLVAPLRHLFPETSGPSRTAFVGSVCVVRTGRVTADFGQAEVTAPDGSSAIIQVRQTGPGSARRG